MNFDFDGDSDDFSVVISDFDFNAFTKKDIVPLKAQHVLACALFSKNVQNMNIKFDVTTIHKAVFDCLQVTYAQKKFLLSSLTV